MNTDCFGANRNVNTVDRAHSIFPQHSQNAIGRFIWIVEQRVRARSWNERPIGQIISVGKNFARNLQTARFGGTRERAILWREKN